MRVLVDSTMCTGHGRCYALAPDFFDCDDEGYSSVRDEWMDVPGEAEDPVGMAVRACPEKAIAADET